MFFEWTLKLLATLFPNSRGDAVALWSGLSQDREGFWVGRPAPEFVNRYPRTTTRIYCSDVNLAQLTNAELVVREIFIPAVKRGATPSTASADTALQKIAPEFLGMVILISSQDCGNATRIFDSLLASSVGGEELLLNLKALRGLLPELIEGLREPPRSESVSVVSAGKRMELVSWKSFMYLEPGES